MSILRKKIACALQVLLLASCSQNPSLNEATAPHSHKKPAKEASKQTNNKKDPLSKKTKDQGLTSKPLNTQKAVEPPVSVDIINQSNIDCQKLNSDDLALPYWKEQSSIVITRVLKSCVTNDGHKGYKKKSPWMAMGFPCAGGKGRVDVTGNYFSPKLVSFIISTDCMMLPNSIKEAQAHGTEILQLDQEAKLIAYHPFAVQYWEIPGLTDADVGFTIDLRSTEGKQRVWREFVDRKPVRTILYGRENAWTMGVEFYKIVADIQATSNHTFKLIVKQVNTLDQNQIDEVKQRCHSLTPKRKCHQVFH